MEKRQNRFQQQQLQNGNLEKWYGGLTQNEQGGNVYDCCRGSMISKVAPSCNTADARMTPR
jgi:hypothetical protein